MTTAMANSDHLDTGVLVMDCHVRRHYWLLLYFVNNDNENTTCSEDIQENVNSSVIATVAI